MSKPFDTSGPAIVPAKPMRLRRYEPHRLPDPGDMVDCLIVVNDRRDGVPRPRLALSDGASWSYIAWLEEIPAPQAAPLAAPVPPIDITAALRQVMGEALPRVIAAAVQPPSPVALPDPDAAAQKERMQAQIRELAQAVADALEELSAKVEHIERTALAEVDLVPSS